MSKPVFAAYDDGGQLIGFAIEAAGMGYQDKIQLLYGYSLTEQAIIGLYVLESRETPGLGDRIGSDEAFLSNFHRLDVSLTADGDAVANPIEFVPPGKKTSPWQIDGITGATVSSRAVSEILRDSTQYWIPRLSALQSQLTDSARHAKS
jgi:electron transport complex protein RnfG